ncbi:MAG: hypothetical protein C0425_02670 [Chlorobiaceae bacterium]|nr:hypothetical protein [Chlorobiaceae bacterium]MBA4309225.1 hypothetical protein [Chlorobiaceae bacterium]
MKKIMIVILLGLFFVSCKEGDTSTNPPAFSDDYFPSHIGYTLGYQLDSIAQSGIPVKIGNRFTTVTKDTLIAGTPYRIFSDSIVINNVTSRGQSFVRSSSAGVYYFIDTSGLSLVVPDSLRRLMLIDREVTALSYPLTIGRSWAPFRLTFLNIPIIDFTALVEAEEKIQINANNTNYNFDAKRIGYRLKLFIPDLTMTGNVINLEFNAKGWFVKGIGLVKLEGNSSIIGFFNGGDINISDTTSVLSQKLISFK